MARGALTAEDFRARATELLGQLREVEVVQLLEEVVVYARRQLVAEGRPDDIDGGSALHPVIAPDPEPQR